MSDDRLDRPPRLTFARLPVPLYVFGALLLGVAFLSGAYLVIVVGVLLALLHGMVALLRWVRADQAAAVVEYWRRNGIT